VLIGLSALIAGWAYSGGPRPLSHTAWGEVFVVAYFGLAAVSGSYLLQAGVFSPASLVVGLALGLHAAAVLTLNNIRDLEADARAGRRTLAQVLGRPAALRAYRFLMLAPFPLLCITPGAAAMGMAWLALPLAVWLAWLGPRLHDGPSMNRQLAFTALAQVLLGGLLGLNLLLRVT
jgi:1,4-dihydroxy-2-naphthoate octaprenyltransferase